MWVDIYEAPGIEEKPIQAEVPREDQSPNAVRRHLLRKGAQLASVEDPQALAAAIAAEAPVLRRAAHMGWRDDDDTFVSHRFVSPAEMDVSIIPPECPMVGAAGQLQIRGTLEIWQGLVAVSQYSTTLVVALCAVFAAPLLALLRRPSFALVFFGPSRIGKSFAQLVAGSALGFGREEDLPSLNATPAGLLAAGLGFNDHMLPINEIGTARGPKSEVYVTLRDSTYSLMNGQDTIRHPSWTGDGEAPSTFRVICLLSSEISPDAWAARNGETRDDGEMARLIGVPVLNAGSQTIFDRPPTELTAEGLSEWEKGQFQRLRQSLPENRGIAFREFIDWLVIDVEKNVALTRSRVASFEAHFADASMTAVGRDIVAKFGILWAAGILAVDAGILPLGRRAIGPVIIQACRAALAELPDPQNELRADRTALKEHLAGRTIIDLEACSRKEQRLMRDADGFHRPRRESGGEEYVVRAQEFSAWFGTPVRVRRLLEWLDDEGLLDHGRDRTTKRSNEWAQKQVTWPDDTRVRSISLYLPGGLSDLDR
ncbi:DUF927 domain-containing protein [Methylobacterium sp. E-045]|uniref:DUF927 domain-containing protein n=1 Tax=Methylobacterium sp. E-045 TaxID=2836575 RepID=UPI001FB87F63|nr:DUF927 domain-containing protein [Methylobacterium sp. E-045]MCJ2127573.1 DUF927 domain-containing protein [Methylobacterium sp. E-045]